MDRILGRLCPDSEEQRLILMSMTLEELVPYVRQNVPQSKMIKHLVADQNAGAVIFEWQSRKFVVKTTLQTFEMKGTRLFITGASGLLQLLLTTKTRHQTVIGELVGTLDEIKGMMNTNEQKAMALLQPVKATLAKLAGQRVVKKPAV